MRLEPLIGGGESRSDLIRRVVDLTAPLLREIERLGVATAADVGLETLVARMSHEAIASSSLIAGNFQIDAWLRV